MIQKTKVKQIILKHSLRINSANVEPSWDVMD
jgi:hypothetical protein